MAQTSYTPISLYYSSTAGNTPTAGNLVAGELAINTADGKLFYKDSAGVVQVIAGKGGAGVAGGSNTQVQYNSSGNLAGSANFTFNGTTVTIANDASISGLTVGLGAGSVATNTAFGIRALSSNTSGTLNNANGYEALRFNTTGGSNTAIGLQSLYSNTTASNNTAVGFQAGYSNTTSEYQTYIGYAAGKNWTGQRNTIVGGNSGAGGSCTGDYNTGIGSFIFTAVTSGTENTAVGYGTLYSLTSGNYNSAFGRGALFSNTTASNNTAVGYQAGYSNTTGATIDAFGYQALYSNTTGTNNVAIGRQAMQYCTTGSGNTTVGLGALTGASAGTPMTGNYNIAIGQNTLNNTSSGSNNVGVGFAALAANTTASSNTAVGYQSLYSNTNTGNNVAVGYASMYSNNGGYNNAALGTNSMYGNTTGISNIAIGQSSLYTNSTGSYNVAVGMQALNGNTTASYNTALGYQAGYTQTTATNNCLIGAGAGYGLTTGSYNTFVGPANSGFSAACGSAVTTGGKNTILGGYNGNQGGLDIRTSNNYIVLSDGDGNPRGIFDGSGNYLVGYATTPTGAVNAVVCGNNTDSGSYIKNMFLQMNYSTTTALPNYVGNWNSGGFFGIGSHTNGGNVRIGVVTNSASGWGWNGSYPALYSGSYTNASDYRLKENVKDYPDNALQQVLALRPITYKLKDSVFDAENSQSGKEEVVVGKNEIGFLAHEVQQIIPLIVMGEKDEIDADGNAVHQGIDYSKLTTVLVKAIQELKAEVDSLKQQLGK